MEMQEIGVAILNARKSRKITQQALADSLGMSRATISSIERATVPEIGIRKIFSICAALGLELHVQEKVGRPTLQMLMRLKDGDGE